MNLIDHTEFLDLFLVGQSGSGKTNIYYVRNSTGHYLGKISWFSPWRRYAFDPATGALLFDAKCLRQIADWCADRTEEHREK